MPTYRSIMIHVIRQYDCNQFPEFPHPDSSQSRRRAPNPKDDDEEEHRPSTSASEHSTTTSKADQVLGKAPTISCYIPYLPGARFYLVYGVQPPYPDKQFFYFKLFMNGRHINSWGSKPRTHPNGEIQRALFEADPKWERVENGRTLLRHGGIDCRPFHFTNETSGISAADEGGVIEIRVFRARGRKRKAPSLERFRPQEQYGINLQSAGLLQKPHDTRYYDWFLVDPINEPYAAFNFHYRSWDSLQTLQLIPSSHSRELLPPSPCFAHLVGLDQSKTAGQTNEARATAIPTTVDKDDEDSDIEKPLSMAGSRRCRSNAITVRGGISPFDHVGDGPECTPTSAFSIPQATLNDWSYQRPLPPIPRAKPSFEESRKSSTDSNAPSLTPSNIAWAERDTPSPEHTISTARRVEVVARSSPAGPRVELVTISKGHIYNEVADNSPKSMKSLMKRLTLTPDLVIPPPSATKDEFGPITPPGLPPKGQLGLDPTKRRVKRDVEENLDDEAYDYFKTASSPPSEAQWLKQRAPSPVKKDPQYMRSLKKKAKVSDMKEAASPDRVKDMASTDAGDRVRGHGRRVENRPPTPAPEAALNSRFREEMRRRAREGI